MDAENVTNRTVKAPPKTGQNAAPGGISRPQLALRGTTWHKPPEKGRHHKEPEPSCFCTPRRFVSVSAAAPGVPIALAVPPPAQSQARVPRGLPTPTNSRELSRSPAPSHEIPRVLWAAGRGAIAASRGRDRFAPDSPHRQAVWPISTGRRRGRVFRTISGGFAGVGAPRDARDVRIAPHYRSRSRLSISGGSVCADSFLVGVPFTLQWPPMAVCEALDGPSATIVPP